MTEPLDSAVVTGIAHRCKASVSNLMTDEELEAVVTSEIISYNEETPPPSDEFHHGPVEEDNIDECTASVMSLIKSYLSGTLPRHVERVVSWTYDPDALIEDLSTLPEGSY